MWLLGGGEDAHECRLSVDQFVLQHGRTDRTQKAHKKLQAICARLGNPELGDRAFGDNHAASTIANERNGWKLIPASFLPDIQNACVEHGHGGGAVKFNVLRYKGRRERRCRGALEICLRGPQRQEGLGLGSWLYPHSPLKPMSHHRRPPIGMGH